MNQFYSLILIWTSFLWQSYAYAEIYKEYSCESSDKNILCSEKVIAPPIVPSDTGKENDEIRITVIPYKPRTKIKSVGTREPDCIEILCLEENN
tara:strand:+ start:933 stop:1214 length:282 start_codon:yes stop_codon:yes gene_type:complete